MGQELTRNHGKKILIDVRLVSFLNWSEFGSFAFVVLGMAG